MTRQPLQPRTMLQDGQYTLTPQWANSALALIASPPAVCFGNTETGKSCKVWFADGKEQTRDMSWENYCALWNDDENHSYGEPPLEGDLLFC